MPVTVFFGVFTAAIGITVAAQSWPLSRAPGWSDLRWFSLAALTASAATIGALGSSAPIPLGLVPWAGRLQLFFLGLHVAVWVVYVAAYLEQPLAARDRIVSWGAVLLGLASLVPGVAYFSGVWTVEVPWLAERYASAESTVPGAVVFAAIGAVPVYLGFRLVAAWRRGVPYAGPLAASFFGGAALGVYDAAVVTFRLPLPYLLEFGHMVPIIVVAWANLDRHADEARALQDLRLGLERAVAERTRELERAQAALIEAERSAAIGRFSARIAHEMNGPAAAVASNLRYVLERLEKDGTLPEDGLASLQDSREAMARLALLARKLSDAARTGLDPGT